MLSRIALGSLLVLAGASVRAQDPCSDVGAILAHSSFVIVTEPRAGAAVALGFTVAGCSRTFESTVNWRLLARDGGEIASGATTGGGSGGPASFRFEVANIAAEPQVVHLEVYEVDASEGEGFPPGRTVLPLLLVRAAARDVVAAGAAAAAGELAAAATKVAEIDVRLAQSDGRSLTLDPERPGWDGRMLKLWSEGELPLKLSVAAPSDAGETLYYYEGGALFFVRQQFAQAVFRDGRLTGWYGSDGARIALGDEDAQERERRFGEESRRWLAAFAGTPPAPGWEHLSRASYEGIYGEHVRLTDGRFEGPPFVAGGAARPSVWLIREPRLVADLTADLAGQEAVVLLGESSGGSGSRLFVAVVGLEDGEPVNLGTALVGDRPQVRAFDVADGLIRLSLVEQGAEDAACCPGQLTTRYWMLQGEKLLEVASESEGRLSLATLARREWKLVQFDRGKPVPAGVVITLSVEDGRVAGSAGCNRYFGSASESAAGAVKLGGLGTTRMACPEPRAGAERQFLERLAGVEKIGFALGKLALTWRTEAGAGTLLFE